MANVVHSFSPMLSSGPIAAPATACAFEPKLDGWRVLVSIDGGLTVRTRNGRSVTASGARACAHARRARGALGRPRRRGRHRIAVSRASRDAWGLKLTGAAWCTALSIAALLTTNW